MNVTDDFSALRVQLDALPEWEPASLDPRRSLVLSIDLNQGFTRMGALSSPRVAGIIPETAAFLRRCRELGLPIAAVTDCHKPDAEEFRSYPAHCLEGTPESELVEEIREFPETVIRKNSTNAFSPREWMSFSAGWRRWWSPDAARTSASCSSSSP